MARITVHGRRTSSNVQALMWGLAELGLAAERHDVGGRHGGTDTAAFGAMNPNRLVPVLVDGDGPPLWESNAILRYLASRYGGAPFWPEDALDRARVDMWMEWGKTTLAGGFTHPIFWAKVRTPARERDEAALDDAFVRFEAVMDRLDARLGDHACVAGPDFTLADIAVGHLLYRYYEVDLPRRPHPAVERYYARLCDRPAYRMHVMVDFSELRAEGA